MFRYLCYYVVEKYCYYFPQYGNESKFVFAQKVNVFLAAIAAQETTWSVSSLVRPYVLQFKKFQSSSRLVKEEFRSSSGGVQEQFKSSSGAFKEHFTSSSRAGQEQFRSSSAAIQEQLSIRSKFSSRSSLGAVHAQFICSSGAIRSRKLTKSKYRNEYYSIRKTFKEIAFLIAASENTSTGL